MANSKTNLKQTLNQSYFLYSALLALKLLAFTPLASFVCQPDKLQRANLSDLKNLTPFWLIAALYTTITPDVNTALTLFRMYFAARCVTAIGYVYRIPRHAAECAFFVSFAITCYMGAVVVYAYKQAF